MEPKDRFNKLLEKYKDDKEFILDGLILRVSEDIAKLLTERNMSRTELAKKLGCSPAYVTKLLRGSENLTLKKLFEISQALNANLNISISMNAGSPSSEAADRRLTPSAKRANGKSRRGRVQKLQQVQ
jgi:transcriptional regulator with XRE-family HTH domain